jgi:hypothetical protein
MSDDKVVNLFPQSPEDAPAPVADEVRLHWRDEMLEVLDGVRGRVEGMEMTGMILIGLSNIPGNDVVFMSQRACLEATKSVGVMEMTKAQFLDLIRLDHEPSIED